jgi:hypothetical protein
LPRLAPVEAPGAAPRRVAASAAASAATALAGALALGGCSGEDLGACDAFRARQVAFALPFPGDVTGLAGQPMFEGQALVTASCGGGVFCHAEVSPQQRLGVPAGLDLDFRLACDARAPAEPCTQASSERLARAKRVGYRHRQDILDAVADGSMPPGALGRDIRARSPRFERADGSPLPELDTPEGRDILRNWLACGLPVVDRAEDATALSPAGAYCGDAALGDCVRGSPRVITPPEPKWSSIYERVIVPQCVSCHGPGPTDYRPEHKLDLSTMEIAYTQMVGATAMGGFCNDRPQQHVVPGNPAESLLILKMEPGDPPCGERMPLDGPYLPDTVIEPIRQWIAAGAMRD